ncbi:unnamed protein product [Tilletia caries]|nr:unnamed protein product [Tilletia caries]
MGPSSHAPVNSRMPNAAEEDSDGSGSSDEGLEPARNGWWDKHNDVIARLLNGQDDPLQVQWREEPCQYCGSQLLQSEPLSFCCNHGRNIREPMQPLTPFLQDIEFEPKAGPGSLRLNQALHFSAQTYTGDRIRFDPGAPAVAIKGSILHRLLPVDQRLSPLNMFLYNKQDQHNYKADDVPSEWIDRFRADLEAHNPLLQKFKTIAEVTPDASDAVLELKQDTPASELAAIIHYGAVARKDPRAIYVHKKTEQGATRINTNNPFYDALAYPVLFPRGEPHHTSKKWNIRKMARLWLLSESRFQHFWKVANMFMLDVVCRMEEARLAFIGQSLDLIRRRNAGIPQQHEVEELNNDETEDNADSPRHPALPSSFVGSRAYRAEQVSDALTLAHRFGRPHGMITVTTNPNWAEFERVFRHGQTATTVPHRRTEDDAMVSQYSPLLLLLWNGHCHIDIAVSHHTFVYLFKYVAKGPDYAHYRIISDEDGQSSQQARPEDIGIDYINARYLSATEACWRIFGLPLTHKSPSVARLAIHDSQANRPQFRGRKETGSDASSLIRYFLRPDHFRDLDYVTYYETISSRAATRDELNDSDRLPPEHYLERTEPALNFEQRVVYRRRKGSKAARIKTTELKTSPDGTVHSTFQQAAEYEGLIENDDEPDQVVQEAVSIHRSPADLRFLFGMLIQEGASAMPIWTRFKDHFSRDYLPYNYEFDSVPHAAIDQAHTSALRDIDHILSTLGMSNTAVGLPSIPSNRNTVAEEQAFFAPHHGRLRAAAAESYERFTAQQKQIYDTITTNISEGANEQYHLIQGRAGRGKTYLLKAIINTLRGHNLLLTVCGATGLSASAFERATTIHKRFAIPVLEDEEQQRETVLRSTMKLNSPQAQYLRQSPAIIIDEIWAVSRSVLEAVNHLLQEISDNDQPFGGKAIIGVGDPRQTAPVTKENTIQATTENSILTSELFPHFTIHELMESQRQADDLDFSSWIDNVGDDITCSPVHLDDMFTAVQTLEDTCTFLFPPDVLSNPDEASKRAFLSPINRSVEEINGYVLERVPSELHVKDARDTIKDAEAASELDIQTAIEVLADIPHAGVPARRLQLKVRSSPISTDSSRQEIEHTTLTLGPLRLESTLSTGAWHGYKEPRITAHSVELIYNKDDVPERYEPRPPTVSGIGKVLLLDEKNKCVKIETASWDRSEATKKTFQLMGYYEPEVRYKNVAKAIPNAYIYFSGRLRSQEPTTSYFAIVLDDTTWASPSSTQTIAAAASSPTTPSKKPRLGGKRSGSEANNPASTSSTASSSKS